MYGGAATDPQMAAALKTLVEVRAWPELTEMALLLVTDAYGDAYRSAEGDVLLDRYFSVDLFVISALLVLKRTRPYGPDDLLDPKGKSLYDRYEFVRLMLRPAEQHPRFAEIAELLREHEEREIRLGPAARQQSSLLQATADITRHVSGAISERLEAHTSTWCEVV